MTTGATGQLGLALPVQGELSGTWGNTVNNAITEYTNIAIAATLTLTNDGAVTLANTTGTDLASNIVSSLTGAGTVTAQFAIVKVTGTLTTAKVVTAPSYSKTYVVVNAATGGIVTFKASGQTGVSIAVGESAWVYFNGTDYVKLAGTATAGAAAGSNTQVQFNSSGALAGSSAFTWDGANIVVNATTPAYYTGTSNLAQISINRSPSTGTIFNASQSAAFMNIDGASGGSSFQFATASAANTQPSEKMRLDGVGTLGIGTTPNVWSGAKAIQFGDGAFAVSCDGGGTGDGSSTWNGYYDGSWRYIYTGGPAARYRQSELGHAWFNAPSGTAGNAITFTQAMTLDASGNFGVGTTSPRAKLNLEGGSTTSINATACWQYIGSGAAASYTSSNYMGVGFGYNNAGNSEAPAFIGFTVTDASASTNGALVFATRSVTTATAPTERMRITSDGNVGLGVTPSAWGNSIRAFEGYSTSGSWSIASGGGLGSALNIQSNAYYDGSNWIYKSTSPAANYYQSAGAHVWRQAASGTAGNAISFTQAMTLSATGGLSVGTTADPGAGAIYATGNITAYYSDARLKTVSGKIENALDKVAKLSGVYYTNNSVAKSFGYDSDEVQVGVLAQEVEAVMPEIVKAAPFDLDENNNSRSGEHYKTVQYERLVPLLIEAVKELRAEVKALKGE